MSRRGAGGAPWRPRFLSRAEWGSFGRRSRQVLLFAALTGLLTGAAVAGFEYAINEKLLPWVESWPLGLQAIAPAVGLIGAALALRHLAGGASPEMVDDYISNTHDRHRRLDQRPVVGRLVASVATLGLGGTMGFEGPSVYLGAAIGSRLQARLSRYFSRDDAKTLMVAGAAAGLAAIFKAPATGAVFAIEVPWQSDLSGRMVLPALCGSAVGYTTFAALRSTTPLLPIRGGSPFDLVDLGGALVVGLACGLGARLFAAALRATKREAHRGRLPVRVLVAGAILAALALASNAMAGAPYTLGPGYRAIGWALDPHQRLAVVGALLLMRAVAVLATVGGGGTGGLFIPLVVEGALLGRILGGLAGNPAGSLFPVLGIAAFLGAGYRTPLTAVMFVAETTG
ncbi:MAG TPA: chloride channel protein, partial [Acidimicrobiales bacterium]